jgi:hypothetical protein
LMRSGAIRHNNRQGILTITGQHLLRSSIIKYR